MRGAWMPSPTALRLCRRTELLIGGEWGEGLGPQAVRDGQSRDREDVIAEVSEAGRPPTSTPRSAPRVKALVPGGAWPAMKRRRAWSHPRRLPAGIMRDRIDELVLLERSTAASRLLRPPDGHSGRHRLPRILRRLGRQAHRRGGAGSPRCADLRRARAGRRCCRHRALEFRADECGVEGCAGARLRLHDRA